MFRLKRPGSSSICSARSPTPAQNITKSTEKSNLASSHTENPNQKDCDMSMKFQQTSWSACDCDVLLTTSCRIQNKHYVHYTHSFLAVWILLSKKGILSFWFSQNKVSPTPVRVAASPFASSRFALCLATRRALRPRPGADVWWSKETPCNMQVSWLGYWTELWHFGDSFLGFPQQIRSFNLILKCLRPSMSLVGRSSTLPRSFPICSSHSSTATWRHAFPRASEDETLSQKYLSVCAVVYLTIREGKG